MAVASPGTRVRGRLVVPLSFALALALAALLLPEWAGPWRPDWPGLVLVYWCMAIPHRVGVASGFALGLLQDVMQGDLLGQNALSRVVLAYLTKLFHLRVRNYPLWQQAMSVAVLLAVNQGISVWIKGVLGTLVSPAGHFLPVLTSMLIWPWLFIVLRDLRRMARIS